MFIRTKSHLYVLCTLLLSSGVGSAGCALFKKPIAAEPFPSIEIPGGRFMMGDVLDRENQDATPVHPVLVAPFELSQFEITYEEYDAYAAESGTAKPPDDGFGRGRRAVVHLTWHEAEAFCRHHGFRLPTEVEWEYAARGAGLPQRYAGTSVMDSLNSYARIVDNSSLRSFIVGSKKPNRLNLYDMSGNVYEWIGDYYEFYPSPGDTIALKNLAQFDMRIIRGGSFKTAANLAQTFWRSGTLADVTSDNIGFRCARSAYD